MQKILYPVALFLCCLLFNQNSIYAKASQDDYKHISDYALKVGKQAEEVMSNSSQKDSEKLEKMMQLMEQNLDTNWIARFVLGKYRKTASKQQIDSFVDSYREYFVQNNAKKFQNYSGHDFVVNNVEALRRNQYKVYCQFVNSADIIVKAEFRIVDNKKTGNIVVRDIVFEGISMINSQRAEFQSIFENQGFEQFVESFAKKVDKMRKERLNNRNK